MAQTMFLQCLTMQNDAMSIGRCYLVMQFSSRFITSGLWIYSIDIPDLVATFAQPFYVRNAKSRWKMIT